MRVRGCGLVVAVSLAAIALAAAAAACGGGGPPPGGDRLSVVASFSPLEEAASRVGGARVDVVNLTPPGAEPHDIELTSTQLDRILEADVVVYAGRGFQPAVEDALRRTRAVRVDVLDGVDLLASGEGGQDPHVWLDPRRMLRIVDLVERALAHADPQGADGYAGRAERYREKLSELDEAFARGLRECERRWIVTAHAAFAYLADRYRLEQVALAGVTPEAEPDPQRLAMVIDAVRSSGATTVFTEPLVDDSVSRTLAREANVRVAVLDPLEGLSRDDLRRGKTYITVMRDNLAALREGLGCD